MKDTTDITYWCDGGNHRERLTERFRGDMMVESQLAETHKTPPKTVQGVSAHGAKASNGVAVAKSCMDNEKKGGEDDGTPIYI